MSSRFDQVRTYLPISFAEGVSELCCNRATLLFVAAVGLGFIIAYLSPVVDESIDDEQQWKTYGHWPRV